MSMEQNESNPFRGFEPGDHALTHLAGLDRAKLTEFMLEHAAVRLIEFSRTWPEGPPDELRRRRIINDVIEKYRLPLDAADRLIALGKILRIPDDHAANFDQVVLALLGVLTGEIPSNKPFRSKPVDKALKKFLVELKRQDPTNAGPEEALKTLLPKRGRRAKRTPFSSFVELFFIISWVYSGKPPGTKRLQKALKELRPFGSGAFPRIIADTTLRRIKAVGASVFPEVVLHLFGGQSILPGGIFDRQELSLKLTFRGAK